MLNQCHIPQLNEPFKTALHDALTYIIEHYNPIGIIGAGSVIRGEGDATSDLDIFVIFEGNYRILVHKLFNGVPAQLFCNPPQRIPRYFEEQRGRIDGGPTTAHMIANGTVILDRDPRLEQLREQARAALQLPPEPNKDLLELTRYHALSALENMLDVYEKDPDMAMIEVCNGLPKMLNYYFMKQGKYNPRHKDIMQILRQDDPELAQLIHDLFATDMGKRYSILEAIADKTLETHTFYEYAWRDENV